MKKCLRCNETMVEGLNLFADDTHGGLEIAEKKIHAKNTTVKPKVSLCANCGYVELYVDEVDKARKFM